MSLSVVRSKFRGMMNTLGFREWKLEFNEDVPNTIQHKSYIIKFHSVTGQGLNQHLQELRCPVEIKFWYDGKADNWAATDQVVILCENIIKQVIPPTFRLIEPIKNIIFDSLSIDGMAESNDSIIAASLSFTVSIILSI